MLSYRNSFFLRLFTTLVFICVRARVVLLEFLRLSFHSVRVFFFHLSDCWADLLAQERLVLMTRKGKLLYAIVWWDAMMGTGTKVNTVLRACYERFGITWHNMSRIGVFYVYARCKL